MKSDMYIEQLSYIRDEQQNRDKEREKHTGHSTVFILGQ